MWLRGNDIGLGSVTGCRLWLLGKLERKSKQTEPEPMSLPLNHLSCFDPRYVEKAGNLAQIDQIPNYTTLSVISTPLIYITFYSHWSGLNFKTK